MDGERVLWEERRFSGELLTIGELKKALDGLSDDMPVRVFYANDPFHGVPSGGDIIRLVHDEIYDNVDIVFESLCP